MVVDGKCFINPSPLPQFKTRYIKIPLNETLCNCKFVPDLNIYHSTIVVLRDISSGDKILTSYGDMYWGNKSKEDLVYYAHSN